MSGANPSSEIECPNGVSHLAIVTLREVSGVMLMTSWTEPFPNVLVPIIVAMPCSLSAPARISEADAEPLFTRITIFKFLLKMSYPLLLYVMPATFLPKSSLTTTLPRGRNQLAISTEASRYPPGFPRRSRMSLFDPDSINSRSAFLNKSCDVA